MIYPVLFLQQTQSIFPILYVDKANIHPELKTVHVIRLPGKSI